MECFFHPNLLVVAKDDFILDGTTIVGYTGTDTIIDIPEGIIEIGAAAFSNQEQIKIVHLPNSLEKIGEAAFQRCSNLEKIEFPETVTSIGKYAFQECAKLSQIKLPDGITTIEEESFNWCWNLTRVTLPKNLTVIEKDAFGGTSIFDLVLPEKLEFIGEEAFSGIFSMTKIYIPASVKKIGRYAFFNNKHLTEIQVDENNQNYSSFEGILYNKSKSRLIYCPDGLEKALISPKAKVIGKEAFRGCDLIRTITIPEGVERIEWGAFIGDSLVSITIPSSVSFIGKPDFYYDEMIIFAKKGSYAANYAQENGYSFRSISERRNK